ncbi:MAG: LPXTG cell wall anchor domain-containing protein, partial [Bacteroidales bacterium]|nr:LPXTG cell wall anchor domain-containing protein [Bacteroidales bacterium]
GAAVSRASSLLLILAVLASLAGFFVSRKKKESA